MRSFNNHVLPAVLVSVLVEVLVATVYIWQRPTFVTSPTPTTSNPTVKILGHNDISVSALRLTGFDGCDSLQTEAILSGLSEAGRVLNGLYIRRSELFNFQEAAAMEYLGLPGLNKPEQGKRSNDCFKVQNVAAAPGHWRRTRAMRSGV